MNAEAHKSEKTIAMQKKTSSVLGCYYCGGWQDKRPNH